VTEELLAGYNPAKNELDDAIEVPSLPIVGETR
jgi:hypothetical protein